MHEELTPAEIDTELARLWDIEQTALIRAASHRHHLAEEGRYALTGINRENTEKWLAQEVAKARAARTEAEPYEDEFANRGGWLRYFLVKNSNGHVHRGTNCTTCFRDTQYGWLVNLADCDEDAMIEEWGELACTVCFPSAPTNPLYNRPSRRDREAQEARAAEKAARDAAKAAKGIVGIDGLPLKDSHGYVLKTKIAARNEFSGAFHSLVFYGLDHPQDFAGTIRRLAPALDRAGIDIVKVATNAIKRAVKDAAPLPHNPYRLTEEQLAESAAEHAANTAQAQALLAELQEEIA
jgi:hypothetical protein